MWDGWTVPVPNTWSSRSSHPHSFSCILQCWYNPSLAVSCPDPDTPFPWCPVRLTARAVRYGAMHWVSHSSDCVLLRQTCRNGCHLCSSCSIKSAPRSLSLPLFVLSYDGTGYRDLIWISISGNSNSLFVYKNESALVFVNLCSGDSWNKTIKTCYFSNLYCWVKLDIQLETVGQDLILSNWKMMDL